MDIKDMFNTPINEGDLIVRAGDRMELQLKVVTEVLQKSIKVTEKCRWNDRWSNSSLKKFGNLMVINKNSLDPLNEKHRPYLEMLDEISQS